MASFPAAGRGGGGGAGEGWSSLTRRLSSDWPSQTSDFFPCLSSNHETRDSVRDLEAGMPWKTTSGQLSFVDALKKPLDSGDLWSAESQRRARAVAELRRLHQWASEEIVVDVLESVNLDQEMASAHLGSMLEGRSSSEFVEEHSSPPPVNNSDSGGTVSLVARPQEQDHKEANLAALNERVGFNVGPEGNTGGESSDVGTPEIRENGCYSNILKDFPTEPEWVEDDIYYTLRRDALRMSRARDQHAHGAAKAFLMGDHNRAKLLSKSAQIERVEAERLHAKAAQQIFQLRNSDGQSDMWKLDLHGLHASEAVAALQQRLLDIKKAHEQNLEKFNDIHGSTSLKLQALNLQQVQHQQKVLQETGIRNLSHQPELKIVTGVGMHSRGGASLPRAIKNFLLQNGYTFHETKLGIITIHPKVHSVKED